MKCDCKGCEDRYVGCHSVCEKYKKFQEENEKFREKLKWDKGDYITYHNFQPRRKRKQRI